MPPHLVRRAAQSLGFSKVEVYPHPSEVMRSLYLDLAPSRFYQRLLASNVGRVVRILRTSTVQRHTWGLVVLTK